MRTCVLALGTHSMLFGVFFNSSYRHVPCSTQNGATPLDLATHGSTCHALLQEHAAVLAALHDDLIGVLLKAAISCADSHPMLDKEKSLTTPTFTTAADSTANHFHPSFAWAPPTARAVIFAWARDALIVQLAATSHPCKDLPDDCLGDVLEFFESTMARVEYMYVATHCSSPEAQAWVRSVVAAAVAVSVGEVIFVAVKRKSRKIFFCLFIKKN